MKSLFAQNDSLGAGNCLDETKYKRVCKEACAKATSILTSGGSALDACEAAIICLENSGNTNAGENVFTRLPNDIDFKILISSAGFGSNLTWDKQVECEASIMDGTTLQYGACTNVTNIQNPISLARALCERQSKLLTLERIPPMVLSGDGASKYAKELNLTLVEPKQLISRKAAKCYEHYRNNVEQYENIYNIKITPMDTVGAICVDLDGNCVAGCSSGGLILKISGRVGQAATYGAGCWAVSKSDSVAATCTTGNGEYLMKTLLAKEIVDDLLRCECPVTSLHNTFKNKFIESPFLTQLREVYGGALSICYDPRNGDGELLWSHTTQSLCLGYQSTLQKNPKVSPSH